MDHKILILKTALAGFNHADVNPETEERMIPGAPLTLVREADNEYDSWAVAVYLGECRIGYISRYKNETIARLIDAGMKLTAHMDFAEEDAGYSRTTENWAYPFSIYLQKEEYPVLEADGGPYRRKLIKNDLDILLNACESLNTFLTEWKNYCSFGDTFQDFMTEDISWYMMYLSGLDGSISWKEAELLYLYLELPLTPEDVHDIMIEKKINTSEYERTIPYSLRQLMDIENRVTELGYDDGVLTERYVKVIEELGGQVMLYMNDDSQAQKRHKKYVYMLRRYLNHNSKAQQDEVPVVFTDETRTRRIVKKGTETGEKKRVINKKQEVDG